MSSRPPAGDEPPPAPSPAASPAPPVEQSASTPQPSPAPSPAASPAPPVEQSAPQPATTEPAPAEHRVGTGVMPAVVSGLVLAAAVLAFVAQNTDQIELNWLVFDFDTTPGVVMLVSLFLGVLASVIIGVIVRRNRRIRLDEKEELARLRAEAPES